MSKIYKHVLFSLTACAFITSIAPAMAKTTLPGGVALPPECTNYDPGRPPPNWPEAMAPWRDQLTAHKGDAKNVCNLLVPLVNISAKDSFTGYQSQNLGENLADGKVIYIDVRTPEEYYWVGAPAQLNSFTLKNGQVVIPDLYLATLNPNPEDSPILEYTVGGKKRSTYVKNVASTNLTNVSHNVPVEYIDPKTGDAMLNGDFGRQVDDLVSELKATRVIFYCRSGDRSSVGCYYMFCPVRLMYNYMMGMQGQGPKYIMYEVEGDVRGNGNGGFEGSSGSNVFIGYRGFPGRITKNVLDFESVSFRDLGLPMATSRTTRTVKYDSTGLPIIDQLGGKPWAEVSH